MHRHDLYAVGLGLLAPQRPVLARALVVLTPGAKNVRELVDSLRLAPDTFQQLVEDLPRRRPAAVEVGIILARMREQGVVHHALEETDRWLGILLDAVRIAGIENDTSFVLLSDHGQINITRTISPNVYLRDKGYISSGENGEVREWSAYVKSAGASAHVYLKDPSDEKNKNEVYGLLCKMAEEGVYGFERVYTLDEVKEKYGLSGDFSFVLEGDGYTSFGEWLCRPAVRGFDLSDYRFGRATHGHAPEKGPQPTFIANGGLFKSGVVLESGSVLDHAPTIAAALGLTLPEAAGKPVYDVLK